MEDGRIGNFIMNAFSSLLDEFDKKYIVEITILTIKSLLPSNCEIAVRIDYERLKKEMELWQYYRDDENDSLLNSINKFDGDIYFTNIDDSVYVRTCPIVFSNTKWHVIRDEVLKNILYTTGNNSNLLEGLLLAKILYLSYNNGKNVIEELKDEIINLSQSDFIEKYREYFKFSIDKYPGNYNIDFERNRIKIIDTLNNVECDTFKTLNGALSIINGNNISEYSPFNRGLYSLINGIEPDNIEVISVYEAFCDYIYKLNKGRIEPKLLYIDEYILPDIKNYEEGDMFYHSLLNKCKVIGKKIYDDKTIITIDTKSGIYNFKF